MIIFNNDKLLDLTSILQYSILPMINKYANVLYLYILSRHTRNVTKVTVHINVCIWPCLKSVNCWSAWNFYLSHTHSFIRYRGESPLNKIKIKLNTLCYNIVYELLKRITILVSIFYKCTIVITESIICRYTLCAVCLNLRI